MKLNVSVDGRAGDLEFTRDGEACRFTYSSDRAAPQKLSATLVEVEPGIYSILVNGRSYETKVVQGADGLYVDIAGHRSVVEVRDPRALSRTGRDGLGEGRQIVNAPMPGKIVRVLVAEGDEVEAGAGLIVVEAMKMQNELKAPKAGRVVQLSARVGATVGMGDLLAAIE